MRHYVIYRNVLPKFPKFFVIVKKMFQYRVENPSVHGKIARVEAPAGHRQRDYRLIFWQALLPVPRPLPAGAHARAFSLRSAVCSSVYFRVLLPTNAAAQN